MAMVNADISLKICDICNSSKVDSDFTTADTSFKDVLEKSLSVSKKTNNDNVDSKTDEKKLVKKFLETVSGECNDEDIEELTDGLSNEQLKNLSELIEKIAQLISSEISNEDLAGKLAGSENSQQTLEINKDDSKTSDEVISSIAAMISQMPNLQLNEDSQTTSNIVENVAPTIIENISENKNIQRLLSSISEKISVSNFSDTSKLTNAELSEFATKLKNISQEISKTIEDAGKQLSQMEITNIKVTADNSAEKNSLLLGESANRSSIKMIKNDSELSELTALSGNAKADVQAISPEQMENVEVPVEKQVLNFIETQVLPSVKDSGTTEMEMTLMPEQLGKISIKLVKTGTELSVSIACNNSMTQKLIESRLPQLVSNLSSHENQTAQVTVVTENQNVSEFMHNFNMSQQSNHQQFQPQHPQNDYFEGNEVSDNAEEAEEIFKEGRLWQTV